MAPLEGQNFQNKNENMEVKWGKENSGTKFTKSLMFLSKDDQILSLLLVVSFFLFGLLFFLRWGIYKRHSDAQIRSEKAQRE